MAVPKSIPLGQREISIALGTKNPEQARLLAHVLSAHHLALFRSRAAGMDIRKILDRLRSGDIDAYKLIRGADGSMHMEANSAEDHRQLMEALREYNEIDNIGRFKTVPDVMDDLKNRHGGQASAAPAPRISDRADLLSKTLAEYKASREALKGKLNEGTEQERMSALNAFEIWANGYFHALDRTKHPDRPLVDFETRHLFAYKEYLVQRGDAFKTRLKKGGFVSLFFKRAQKQGHYPSQSRLPTEGVFTQEDGVSSNNESKRVEYSEDDLRRIFSAENFKPKKPHEHFVPLIALFSGARLAEVSGIALADFQVYRGIAILHLKGTKTYSSDRKIPVHPRLVQLGLLDYVEDLRAQGYDRLFPYLTKLKNKGYGKVPGDAFNRYLAKLGVKPAKEDGILKDFHSLRHTFNHQLIDEDVAPEKREDLQGHSNSSINKGTYGKAFAANILLPEMQKAEYAYLDLSHAAYQKGMYDTVIPQLMKRKKPTKTSALNAGRQLR